MRICDCCLLRGSINNGLIGSALSCCIAALVFFLYTFYEFNRMILASVSSFWMYLVGTVMTATGVSASIAGAIVVIGAIAIAVAAVWSFRKLYQLYKVCRS